MKKIGRRCKTCLLQKTKDHFPVGRAVCKSCVKEERRVYDFNKVLEERLMNPRPYYVEEEPPTNRDSFKKLILNGPDVTIYEGIKLPQLPKKNSRNKFMDENSEQLQKLWGRQPLHPWVRRYEPQEVKNSIETIDTEEEEEDPFI